MPSWNEDNSKLYVIMLDDAGKRIDEVSIDASTFKTLFRSGFKDISQPVVSRDHIFFRGIYSGIDNIYAFGIRDSSIHKVTSVAFGAFDPCLNHTQDTLLFSSYTANGYQVCSMLLDSTKWIKSDEIRDQSVKLYPAFEKQELGIPLPFPPLDSNNVSIKKYRKGTHLFNVHSWAPLYINSNTYEVSSGVTILSQNNLSTAFTQLSYKYNYSDRTSAVEGSFIYKGWFPVLSMTFSRGDKLGFDTTGIGSVFRFNEDRLTLSASVPLNLTRGKYSRGLTPTLINSSTNFHRNSETPVYFKDGLRNIFEYDLRGYRYLKMSQRDLLPRWGQSFRLNFRQSPLGRFNYGNAFVYQASLLFPGILKHHSLKFDYGNQSNHYGDYNFSNYLLYPRGYFSQVNQEFSRLIVEYRLPLCYPDFKIGPLLYLKRVKGLLFYDTGKGKNKGISRYYESTGLELTGDMHLFNFIVPIELGGRGIYLPTQKDFLFEFIFNISFFFSLNKLLILRIFIFVR